MEGVNVSRLGVTPGGGGEVSGPVVPEPNAICKSSGQNLHRQSGSLNAAFLALVCFTTQLLWPLGRRADKNLDSETFFHASGNQYHLFLLQVTRPQLAGATPHHAEMNALCSSGDRKLEGTTCCALHACDSYSSGA